MGFLGFGKPRVEKLKENRDIEGLIKALKGKDWGDQVLAAEALGEIGDARAMEPLIATLENETSSVPSFEIASKLIGPCGRNPVRLVAAMALGRIGDARAIVPLEKLAQNGPSQEIRHAAQVALTKLRGKFSERLCKCKNCQKTFAGSELMTVFGILVHTVKESGLSIIVKPLK